MASGKGRKTCNEQSKGLIVVRMAPILNTIQVCPKMGASKSSFNYERFRNAVDFNSKEKWPCESSWQRDTKLSHVRNQYIKDLPFSHPRCCTDIFNHMRDKKNARKLRSYRLDKSVRPIVRGLTPEPPVKCAGADDGDVKFVQVPECYPVERDSCDSSDEDVGECAVPRRSESECSGCSTLGEGFKKSVKRRERVDFHEILMRIPLNPCDKILGPKKNLRKIV